ncbi:hypothetical protein Glove_271g10 [Diversispora epigaea]|uniref:F-box domain-containing protein n=1 Tax=Diversispora epigaea TaxID=1348612 RepID=A0A397I832_9GLOM|nr:hypothetical protein Glove_271g10 [Diversispora epigaea]
MGSQLPTEILEKIMYFAKTSSQNISTIYSCALVNRLWCRVAIRILWKKPFKYVFDNNDDDRNYSRNNIPKSTKLLICYFKFFNHWERIDLKRWYIDLPETNDNNTTTPPPTPPLFEYPYFLKDLDYISFIFSIEKFIKFYLSSFLCRKYKSNWKEMKIPNPTFLNSEFLNPITREKMKSKNSIFFNHDDSNIHSIRKNRYKRIVKIQTIILGQFLLKLFIRKGSILNKLKLVCNDEIIYNWNQTCKYAALVNNVDILKYLGTIRELKVTDMAYNIEQSKFLGELAITCSNLKHLDITFYRTYTKEKHIPSNDLASLILTQKSLTHFLYKGIATNMVPYSLITQSLSLKYIEFEKTDFKGLSIAFYGIAKCEVLECLIFKLCRFIDSEMLMPMFERDSLPKLKEIRLSEWYDNFYKCEEELEKWIRWKRFKKTGSYLEHKNLIMVAIYRSMDEETL